MDQDLATIETGRIPANVNHAMVQTREMTEIQAMVISAKRFPRDMAQVRSDILASCDSPALAEYSQYAYVKGGTEITGASIRLAEELAGAFQNIDKGWVELERKPSVGSVPGESVVQCFAWDMQRNVKAKRTFTVRHWRDTKKGGYALRDEREVYELCANMAARRLRACILEIVPKYLVDEAIERCDETLKRSTGKIDTKLPEMLTAFAKLGVTKEMIEKKVQRKVEAIDPVIYQSLRKIYSSMVDGMSDASTWFEADKAATAPAEVMTEAPAAAPETKSIVKKETKPKNFATPEGRKELEDQAAKKAEEDARQRDEQFNAMQGPPDDAPAAPTFADAWAECVVLLKQLNWSPARMAEFTKEICGKSPAQMQRENDTDGILKVYRAIMAEAGR